MEADHRGLVRYLTSSDQNYIVVRDCLTELFDTIMDEDGETGMQTNEIIQVSAYKVLTVRSVRTHATAVEICKALDKLM